MTLGISDYKWDYRGREKRLHFEKCFGFMLHIFIIVGNTIFSSFRKSYFKLQEKTIKLALE